MWFEPAISRYPATKRKPQLNSYASFIYALFSTLISFKRVSLAHFFLSSSAVSAIVCVCIGYLHVNCHKMFMHTCKM